MWKNCRYMTKVGTPNPVYTPGGLLNYRVGTGVPSTSDTGRYINTTADRWWSDLGSVLPIAPASGSVLHYVRGIVGGLYVYTANNVDAAWIGIFKYISGSTWRLVAGIAVTGINFGATGYQAFDITLSQNLPLLVSAGDVLRYGLILHYKASGGSGNGPVTYRPVISVAGVGAAQITMLNLYGFSPSNTDDYKLYWKLVTSGGNKELYLYSDAAKTVEVAKGVCASGNCDIMFKADLGLGPYGTQCGYYFLSYTADSDDATNIMTFNHPDTSCPSVYRAGGTLVADPTSGSEFTELNPGITKRQSVGMPPSGYVKLKTAARIAMSAAPSIAGGYHVLPVFEQPYLVQLTDLVASVNQTLTAKYYDKGSSSGAQVLKATVLYDGTTGSEGITFDAVGGGTVKHSLASGEGAKKHLLALVVRPSGSGAYDVVWQDCETGRGPEGAVDFTTISHAAKQANVNRDSHGSNALVNDNVIDKRLVKSPPYWVMLYNTNTPTVASIKVHTEPLVILGDSQCGSTPNPNLLANNTYGIPAQFKNLEQERVVWLNASAGRSLGKRCDAIHSAASHLFASEVAGIGDLCEVPGIVVLAGMGANDLPSDLETTTAAGRNSQLGQLIASVGRIIKYAYINGSTVFIVGLCCRQEAAQYSGSYMTLIETIQRYNCLMRDLARLTRCSFYDPYELTRSGLPTSLYTYEVNDGDWDESEKYVIKANAFTTYAWTLNDMFAWKHPSTGKVIGQYIISQRVDASTIKLSGASFGGDMTGVVDGYVIAQAQAHYSDGGAQAASVGAVTEFLKQSVECQSGFVAKSFVDLLQGV